jgi:putative spermidine/putrescine transport system permease protein
VNSSRLRPFLLPIVAVSFFVPALLRLYGWMSILGSQGIINDGLAALGIAAAPLLFTESAVIIGLADFSIPFAVLTLAGSISYLDSDLERAAKNLGATGFQTFTRVTLRLMLPGLATAFVLSFVQSVSAVVTPLLLGGGRVPMLATQVYNSMIVSVNYPFASAIVLIIVIVVGSLTAVVGRLGRGREARTEP